MADSDGSDSIAGSKTIGKPPDLIWKYFDTVAGPVDKCGKPTIQVVNNRAHRKCNGCGKLLKSCTVKAGAEHLNSCAKAKKEFPGMLNELLQDKLRKANKGKRPAQSSLDGVAIPIPRDEERENIMRALLDMLIMCGIAFRVVESPWFKRFCRYLRPDFIPACELNSCEGLCLN